jgi:rRNA maturation RNase YbeY
MSDESFMFHVEHPQFELEQQKSVRDWLHSIAEQENCSINQIQYIFLTDEEVLEINRNYLDHDYFTDIITFPLNDEDEDIEAEIYISIDRVRENAKDYEAPQKEELLRVMAHGLLHLCGYNDASDEERKKMRAREDECLALYPH